MSALLVIYVLSLLCAFFFSERLIFQPRPSSYTQLLGGFSLKTPDGETLYAVYLPNPEAVWTIFYSHGNGEDLGDVFPVLEELRRSGFSVFAHDYRGYGNSSGQPGEKQSYRDVDLLYGHLTGVLHISPERILAYGRSLGGGLAVELASRHPVGGLVLESAFVSAYRVMTRVPLFPLDKFQNLKKLKKVHCPVLVLHGREDEVVAFWHGERLFREASEPKRFLWVDGAHHNDFQWMAGDAYWQALRDFCRSDLKQPA